MSDATAPPVTKARIWGWMSFDWASQPFNTLGLTFIFGPYFAAVATVYFLGWTAEETAAIASAKTLSAGVSGPTWLAEEAAKAEAQSLWSLAQLIAGLFIAFTAPVLGALADTSGRRLPWIAAFSVLLVVGAWSPWFLYPDATNLYLVLIVFWIGFIAAESTLNFVNAYLPSLGDEAEVGRISGSGSAFGYWGGVLALFVMLIFFAEDDSGTTFVGFQPLFGLDPEAREGTRSVGPFIALWYIVFMIPFFLYVRDDTPGAVQQKASLSGALGSLKETFRSLGPRKSLRNFLIASMFYRDGLNALYTYGGIYAVLILGWSVVQTGIFGIVAAITAAILTWFAGLMDRKYGPKPVIITAILPLILVCIIIVFMTREHVLGIPLPPGSALPDIIFYLCGSIIGGCGGAIYSASRSLMVRHAEPEKATEAFGLFALSGKATTFLAPALIFLMTQWTGSAQLGFSPLIIFFIIGLIMLGWVNKNGDRAA